MKFEVIIAGGRDFDDYELLKTKCDYFFSRKKPTAIICGKARGADTLGERYAQERGIPVKAFPANWKRDGRRAGMLRNVQMAEHADGLVVFWDGSSHGTKHMIETAARKDIPTKTVYYAKRDG